MVSAYIQVSSWQSSAYNQCQIIRNKLFRSILKQEISWFDTHEVGELNTRLTEYVECSEIKILAAHQAWQE